MSTFETMNSTVRQVVCMGVAVTLLVSGTLASGLFSFGTLSQILAGAMIVAGFAVAYFCLGAFQFGGE